VTGTKRKPKQHAKPSTATINITTDQIVAQYDVGTDGRVKPPPPPGSSDR
jgi:hypothetical protein